MFGANQANDKSLLKSVTQRLARGTGSQTRTTAAVQGGTVTLSGTLRYEAQRIPIVKEVGRIAGVRRVVDLLKVLPKAVYPTGPTVQAATGVHGAAEMAPRLDVESDGEPGSGRDEDHVDEAF
jgi:hypothetical protein